jgi:small conductance mechanosensitive channel
LDYSHIAQVTLDILTRVGLQVLAAFFLWMIGRRLINFAIQLMTRALDARKVDETLVRYLGSTVAVTLNIALVIAILGYFGVETTTFAALIAAGGVAIGLAWSGLLANFAAGAFLVILHPFKVGDFIEAGGIVGTVKEIGLFVTTVVTPDNVVVFVGNNSIFAGNIKNFSANAFRRVDLLAQLAQGTDHKQAIALLKQRLEAIPNVVKAPAPDVEILEFNPMGPVLAVRPYTHTDHYWQVYFDTNRLIRESFGEAGFATPAPQFVVRAPA